MFASAFASLSNSSSSTDLLFNFQASNRSPEIFPELPLRARTHTPPHLLLLSTRVHRVFVRAQLTSPIAAGRFNVPPDLMPPPLLHLESKLRCLVHLCG